MVNNKLVYAIEGLEGTNSMIDRVGILYNQNKNYDNFCPVLIKIPKIEPHATGSVKSNCNINHLFVCVVNLYSKYNHKHKPDTDQDQCLPFSYDKSGERIDTDNLSG